MSAAKQNHRFSFPRRLAPVLAGCALVLIVPEPPQPAPPLKTDWGVVAGGDGIRTATFEVEHDLGTER